MRIAMMGAGGIGGYIGARLAQAGGDVSFIARGAHLAAMLRAGLRIQSDLGSFVLTPVSASEAAVDIGPVDLVIFAVKLYDSEDAAASIAPLIADNTRVYAAKRHRQRQNSWSSCWGRPRDRWGYLSFWLHQQTRRDRSFRRAAAHPGRRPT